MKKKIFFAVVALILVICFPITSYAASFDSVFWGTVMENVTYYYGSAGYGMTTYEYEGGFFNYYHFENLSTDADLLNYLTFGNENLDHVTIYDSDGNDYELIIGYLWWLPLNNITYYAEDGYLYVDVIISWDTSVTYPETGTTLTVASGSRLLYEDSDITQFRLIGVKDYNVADTTDAIVDYEVDSLYKFSAATSLGWSNTSTSRITIKIDASNFSQYTALGIQLMTFDSTNVNRPYINPYTVLGLFDSRNVGTVEMPDASNQDIVDGIEQVGNQIANMEQSLLQPDENLNDVIDSQNQQKDEVLDVGDEILDAMDRIEKPDYNQAKDAVDIYLQDYDVDLARKYLGFVSTSPYLSALVVLSIFFSLLSFVLFGKKA